MQPFFNGLPDGDTVPVLGIGDGIAQILREYLVEGEPTQQVAERLAPATV